MRGMNIVKASWDNGHMTFIDYTIQKATAKAKAMAMDDKAWELSVWWGKKLIGHWERHGTRWYKV